MRLWPLVLLLALGGGAVLWLLGPGEGSGAGGGPGLGPAAGTLEEDAGPMLRGLAPETPHGEAVPAATGRWRILGVVLGPDGEAVPGIEVEAVQVGRGWQRADPAAWNRPPEQELLDRVGRLLRGEARAAEGSLRVTGVTDAAGSFELRLPDEGTWRVGARPAPPAWSQDASAWLGDGRTDATVSLKIATGSALRGRVVDAGGTGVAGRVFASWTERTPEGTRAWHGDAAADPEGRFLLGGVPEGTLRVDVAVAGGRRYEMYAVRTPREDEVVLVLPGGPAVVAGTVTDRAGAPVAGAQLVLLLVEPKADGEAPAARDAERDTPRSTTVVVASDADGRFRADGLPAARLVRLEAAAVGFLPTRLEAGADGLPSGPLPGTGALEVQVVLGRGGRIEGHVRELGTGAPIAGARVRALPIEERGVGPREPRVTETAAGGGYVVDRLGPGRWLLLVDHPDHVDPEMPVGPRTLGGGFDESMQRPPASRVLVVAADEATLTRDVELARGVRVRGRVVGPEGEGITGAEVHRAGDPYQMAWSWNVGSWLRSEPLATSGAGGAFETTALPPATGWVLFARREGLVGRPGDPVDLEVGVAPPPVVLALEAGATLRGRVVEEDGTPVVGAQVGAWSERAQLQASQRTVSSDMEGRFELVGVAPGTVQLNAWHDGRQPAEHVKVEGLAAGEVREGLVLTFVEGVEVGGRLVTPDGAPVPRFTLYVRSDTRQGYIRNVTTDDDGAFRAAGFQPGDRGQMMVQTGAGLEPVGPPFTAPARDLVITYTPPKTATLRGTVVGPDGAVVPLCRVTARVARGAPVQEVLWGGPDQSEAVNGRFERVVRGDGPYVVEVSEPRDAEGNPLPLRPAVVRVVDPTALVSVRLEAGSVLVGRVLGPDGEGVAGVRLAVGRVTDTSDARGAFALAGLAPGAARVEVAPPEGWIRRGPVPVEVPAGAAGPELVVRLEKGLEITGFVVGMDGARATSGGVQASWEGTGEHPGGSTWAQLDGEGGFRLQGLPPGARADVTATLWDEEGASNQVATLTGVPAGSRDVELRVVPGAEVSGIVMTAEGDPVATAWVSAERVAGGTLPNGWVQSGADGRFTFRGLPSGRLRVRAMRQGTNQRTPEVEVDAPADGVRLVFPPTTTLRGVLVGAASSGGAWFASAVAAGSEGVGGPGVRVGADGTFVLEGLARDRSWWILATAGDEARYARTGPVDPTAAPDVVRLVLEEGRRITGVVRAADGTSVPGAWVFVRGEGWRSQHAAGDDGTFATGGLPPGRYTLSAGSPDGEARGEVSEVEAGAASVVVTLE